MSVYKVPQDVEADDKLLGPFNFRQFIYLIVACGLIFLAIMLFQIFPGLIIIPAPFIIFLLALALPLKKDQPMEMYLAAVISYHLRPNKRIWEADGIEHLIEISAPVKKDEIRTKDIAHEEASRRLSYLADIVDTEGWAIKNAVSQNSNLHQDVVSESQGMTDLFENRADRIDSLLQNTHNSRKQQIIENMNTARNLADFTNYNANEIQAHTYTPADASELYRRAQSQNRNQANGNYLSWQNRPQEIQQNTPQNFSQNQNSFPQSFPQQNQNFENPHFNYNPYPESMHQSVISPIGQQRPPQNQPQPPNPEIMRLVSEGKDLNIETLARQAEKITKKPDNLIDVNSDEEIVISLR